MAEYTANAIQTVTANQNVVFTDSPVFGNCSIIHRDGSGLITLRGLTNQSRARFRATFSGNIAIPATGTVEAISVALAMNGESIATTNMIVTPAAATNYFNVSSSINIDVPKECCSQLSVKNTSTQDILVQNANIIIERIA